MESAGEMAAGRGVVLLTLRGVDAEMRVDLGFAAEIEMLAGWTGVGGLGAGGL